MSDTLKLIQYSQPAELVAQLNSGQLMSVDSRSRCGLIVYKRYYAEFAGPGAAVGGFFDIGSQRVVPVGNVALAHPEKHEDRSSAYTIRRHWIRLAEQMTENPVPLQRAKMLLTQFEHYFGLETVNQIPDEALALIVGVLPQTIRMVRRPLQKKKELVAV